MVRTPVDKQGAKVAGTLRVPSAALPRRIAWPAAGLAALLLSLCAPPMELCAQNAPRIPAFGPPPAAQNVSPPPRNGPRLAYPPQATVVDRPLPPQIVALPAVHDEMDVVHHRSQLIVARTNILRTAISDPSVIEAVQFSPNEISIIGLNLGSTTLTMWFDNSPEPLIYLVRVVRDPSIEERRRVDYGKLERKLALLFPNSQVYLIPLSGKIVVKGQARDAEEAAQILSIIRGEVINQDGSLAGPQPAAPADYTQGLTPFGDLASSYIVNMLEVPGEFQVMLRVRIAELNRSQLRRMGVDMEFLLASGRHAITALAGGIPATLGGVFENGEISVLINWLASNGTAKILDEPTLTVMSGHPASFLSGGEFAVPTIVGIGGAQGQTTTFRGFGTSLFVTPTVLDKDLIRMQITPEFSELSQDAAVGGIPSVGVRRVQTTVELREGQTIAMAGLISRRTRTEITRIPLLGEIPVIGPKIFNAKRATEEETELLIMVTPELVRPMDADEVPPLPGFYVTHPNDHDLYHYALTEGAPDMGAYQLAPYGRGAGYGIDVGYQLFEPAPATPQYGPIPTAPYGPGVVPQQPMFVPGGPQHHPPMAPPSQPPVPHGIMPPPLAPPAALHENGPSLQSLPPNGRTPSPAAPPGGAQSALHEESKEPKNSRFSWLKLPSFKPKAVEHAGGVTAKTAAPSKKKAAKQQTRRPQSQTRKFIPKSAAR